YAPHPPYGHQQQAHEVSPHEATHQLRSPLLPPAVRPDPSTAEYTARSSQVPHPDTVTEQRAPAPRSHRRRGTRRPGPPARVAVPVLLLALACYAVGFWALTRV
ncbi:serine/threonine protein kinase, partial [Streptomyces griseorubens]